MVQKDWAGECADSAGNNGNKYMLCRCNNRTILLWYNNGIVFGILGDYRERADEEGSRRHGPIGWIRALATSLGSVLTCHHVISINLDYCHVNKLSHCLLMLAPYLKKRSIVLKIIAKYFLFQFQFDHWSNQEPQVQDDHQHLAYCKIQNAAGL